MRESEGAEDIVGGGDSHFPRHRGLQHQGQRDGIADHKDEQHHQNDRQFHRHDDDDVDRGDHHNVEYDDNRCPVGATTDDSVPSNANPDLL